MSFKRVSKGIYEYVVGRPAIRQSLYINFRGLDGTPVKEKVNTMSIPEAKKLLANKKYELDKARKQLARDGIKLKEIVNYKKIKLDDMAKLYFDNRRTKLNEEDIKKYNTRIRPTLGSKLVSRISTNDIQELQDKLKPHYAPKTLNETINSLRAMFNQGIKKKWCEHNPVNREEIKNLDIDSEPSRVLTDIELKKMFDTFKYGDVELNIFPNSTLYFFTKLAYFTGTRPTAVMDMQVKHVNFNNNTVHLKAMKKGKSYQQRIRQEVIDMIKDWIKLHELTHSDFLFYPQQVFQRSKNLDDKKYSMNYSSIAKSAKKVFDKLFNQNIPVKDLAYKVTLYSLRRTAGTNRYKSKGLVSAKNFLNHTNVQTTMIYLNVTDDFTEDEDDGL
jgi:integrase